MVLFRMGGLLLAMLTVLLVVLAIAFGVGARDTDVPLLRRPLTRLALAGMSAWALALLVPALLVPHVVLPAGAELQLCGLDCHLHIGATADRSGPSLAVALRLRSDARREDEQPHLLTYRVVAPDGRHWLPDDMPYIEPLAAGQTRTVTLHFPVPEDVKDVRLEAAWAGTMDLLIPGSEQLWIKRRTTLALGTVS